MNMKTRDIILVSIFAALTAIGAFIKIPIGPAPITLQLLFTTLAGVLLGSKLGALSQLIYVLLGLVGIPVFTEGGGFSYILKPTFGYLLGFILGAYIIGKIAEHYKKVSTYNLFFACLIGTIVIYIIGVPYLYLGLKYVVHKDIGFINAIKVGCIVFLPGDLAKCLLTAALGKKIIPTLNKSKGF
ncbi:biotin transporter BioY [Clostridium acetireducens DSM 10703]|uniref:Biotin transporter n=1 Tax=Clostridium acetireducens DSM 10703 TaxID=1121290 RepID=A0A1E8EYY6_9CLOT|nr:biotin transporter BioY [Clostridium acetireducens]OFI06073.1 biotin transporter BioY [Clostridium acetireducens DSM 10703]